MLAQGETSDDGPREVKDANGNPLASGDTVVLIKDLKVKGSSIVLKKGTKIKGIRLPEGAGDHEVDCKTEQGAYADARIARAEGDRTGLYVDQAACAHRAFGLT